MRILNVGEVAQYLLLNQREAGSAEGITNMKLQKLCYYAQGLALVKLHRPLFSDDIEHWQHGPVVPALWREYKGYGSRLIPIPDRALGEGLLDDETRRLLDQVIINYGPLSAWELRNKSRSEPPWIDTPDGCAITHQKMRSYFQTVVDEMVSHIEHSEDDDLSDSLASRMAEDSRFRELTERGLAELAAGQYYPWVEVRRSLADL